MKGSRKLWLGLKAGIASVVFAFAQEAVAQQNGVTAIDIALEPDATIIQHTMADTRNCTPSPSNSEKQWKHAVICKS